MDVPTERASLRQKILTTVDPRLDSPITGYVYSDWTTDRGDDNYCFYVGKGTQSRVRKLHRNMYHDSIAAKHGCKRVIEAQFTTERELLLREIDLIEERGTYIVENDRGSNLTLGGEGSHGYRYTAEQRSMITREGNPMFGRHFDHSSATKKKISEKKMMSHPTRKSIEQVSLDGCVIRTFRSAREIEHELGYNHASISKCCLGQQSTAYGFMWRFESSLVLPKPIKNRKRVCRLDASGSVVSYSSIHEAARETGVSASAICRCCKAQTFSASGTFWAYLDETSGVDVFCKNS